VILAAPSSLPKWKGKRITRSVREWTLVRPAEATPDSQAAARSSIDSRSCR
jgi:hypothetical protein